MSSGNYYDVLRVSRRASQNDLENARNRTIVHHSHQSKTTIKEINEAFHHLSDPQKRREYDFVLDHPTQMQAVIENEASLEKRSSVAFYESSHNEDKLINVGYRFMVDSGFHSYAHLIGKFNFDEHTELDVNASFSIITIASITMPLLLQIVEDMQQRQLLAANIAINEHSLHKLKTTIQLFNRDRLK